MVQDPEASMLAARTLQALTPSIRDIAEETGMMYRTLRAWRSGTRSPGPDTLRRFAELADERADTLRGLAVELRRAASDESRHR